MDEKLQENNCSKAIKPINTDTVHKICSGQVVLSLAVAVKELVENSLDAGATIIEIRFKNYGIELIEVSDNGSGVAEDNFMAMTLKHHTSKLSEYSDLLGVSSFGFRGEALSSLCALANIIITTKHQASDYATKLEYDHNGQIVKKTLCSRQVGTTVCLSNLFYSLPVRQKEFHKNVKREFNKMTQLLYAYCLISLGVKITCTNQINSNSKTIVVSTTGSMSYKDNIASIFGIKQLQSLLEIKPEYVTNIKDNIFRGLSQAVEEIEESVTLEDIEIDLSEDSNDADPNKDNDDSISISQRSKGYKNEVCPIEFTGFISTCAHGSGRSSTDRQFFYVNSRPCEPTKVIKIINEVYRQYNPNQYPFLFLNINLDRNTVDVNVTPDKRKIFLTKEKIVLDILKNSLHKLFENIPKNLKIEGAYRQQINDIKPDITQPRIFNSFLSQFNKKPDVCSSSSHDRHENKSSELKRKNTSITEYITSKLKKPAENTTVNDVEEDNYEEVESETSKTQCNNQAFPKTNRNVGQEEIDEDTIMDNKEIIYLESTDNLPCTQIRTISDVVIEKSHTTTCKTKTTPQRPSISNISNERPTKIPKVVTDKEDLGKINRVTVNLKTSYEQVKALTEMYNEQKATTAPDRIKFKSTINPAFNKKCEEELSKEIAKESFKNMEVIGQFNLGFIITRLEDDLFIIDQHATDEIYNFETLQKTTELTNQKLVIPQQLELTGVNEEILIDNLEIFKKNGFTFEINPEAPLTKRVKLLTIPMSKNWVFGKEDIEELLFMLRESPSEFCRPSRVRAMFASRACRKSVMIGTALAKADMKKLVDHMAEIDKPWNCPHGRPTIRHLVNLAMVNTKREAE